MEEVKEKICQSCGMPLKETSDFGSNEDGSKSQEYCRHCFQAGKFSDEHASMKDFINSQVNKAVSLFGMTEDEARKMASSTIPGLKRWRSGGEPNKKTLMVLLAIGIAVFVVGLVTFFITSDGSGGDDDSSMNLAIFIPIWTAAFVPIFVARKERLRKDSDLVKKKILAVLLILGVAFLVGALFFYVSSK